MLEAITAIAIVGALLGFGALLVETIVGD